MLEYLAGKSALVILDNCEHLVDAVADFVEQFLARTGDAVILATSREALDIDGEQLVHLPSLATSDGDSPAVRLFAERATAVEPRFALDETNTLTIATICERLDGMPLAIELAAARITVMTPAELLAGLDDRFQLLSGGRRRQRQRTLEATLDWSYNLLEPKHQDVFPALGVFVGGFDLDAVAAVADIPRPAALDTIEALVAKSLVVRLDAPSAATRFGLLETLKAYAEDRLIQTDEAARIRDRHADYYHQLTMSSGEPSFRTPGSARGFASTGPTSAAPSNGPCSTTNWSGPASSSWAATRRTTPMDTSPRPSVCTSDASGRCPISTASSPTTSRSAA